MKTGIKTKIALKIKKHVKREKEIAGINNS